MEHLKSGENKIIGNENENENEELELSEEERAELNKLADEAIIDTTQVNEEQDINLLNAVAGVVNNSVQWGSSMTLLSFHVWEGLMTTDPPATIARSTTGNFTMLNAISGSRGAVIYVGRNERHLECAWLFAWSAINGEKKVYTASGIKNLFVNINWNDVRNKLDGSTDAHSSRRVETNTRAVAQIVNGSQFGWYTATVTFSTV